MHNQIRAVFRDGVLYPETPLLLPNNAEVRLIVQEASASSEVVPPAESDPDERRRILKRVTARMQTNPLPRTAPRLTRDELHERR